MSYNTIEQERESGGSFWSVYHTIDITGLDAAGVENYNPGSRFGVDPTGVQVVGQADATVDISWDHVNEQLRVVNIADGTDVASGTAVGEVVLRVDGE